MKHIEELKEILKKHLNWHGARITFLALFISAIYQVRTVNLTELAVALNPKVEEGSNYRRLRRFFGGYALNEDTIARLIVSLIPASKEGYILSLDRTVWQFGQVWLNLLVLGIVYKGVAIPVCWMPLDKKGNSNTLERIAILEIFISLFGKGCIHCLTADREFVGKAWFNYLKQEAIVFRIRIKRNTQVSTKNGATTSVTTLFQHLAPGQSLVLKRTRAVWGLQLYLVGLKLENGQYLIIATNKNPHTALADYAQRWHIETLFAVLKSRGFRLEDTHFTDGERLCKLFALLAIVTLWAILVGDFLHQQKPIPLKKHGRLAKSIFRYGFNFLRTTFLHIHFKLDEFFFSLQFLSCT